MVLGFQLAPAMSRTCLYLLWSFLVTAACVAYSASFTDARGGALMAAIINNNTNAVHLRFAARMEVPQDKLALIRARLEAIETNKAIVVTTDIGKEVFYDVLRRGRSYCIEKRATTNQLGTYVMDSALAASGVVSNTYWYVSGSGQTLTFDVDASRRIASHSHGPNRFIFGELRLDPLVAEAAKIANLGLPWGSGLALAPDGTFYYELDNANARAGIRGRVAWTNDACLIQYTNFIDSARPSVFQEGIVVCKCAESNGQLHPESLEIRYIGHDGQSPPKVESALHVRILGGDVADNGVDEAQFSPNPYIHTNLQTIKVNVYADGVLSARLRRGVWSGGGLDLGNSRRAWYSYGIFVAFVLVNAGAIASAIRRMRRRAAP